MDRHEHYEQMVLAIIKAQVEIIGPVAVDQAKKVAGIELDWDNKQVQLSGDPRQLINQLVDQYKVLFGQISVEVCKDAVSRHAQALSAEEVPELLR